MILHNTKYTSENSRKNEWTTDDLDILRLPNVAKNLARASGVTKWKTDVKEILLLGVGIPYYLAKFSHINGWTTQDKDVLNMHHNIATALAWDSKTTGWTTDDVDVLLKHEIYFNGNKKFVFEILYSLGKISRELYNTCAILRGELYD